MSNKPTIVEAAVDQGIRVWTKEQAIEQIKKLLRQIGILENRNADLEIATAAISGKCYWRVMGYCDLRCGGRVFCNTEGLTGLDFVGGSFQPVPGEKAGCASLSRPTGEGVC